MNSAAAELRVSGNVKSPWSEGCTSNAVSMKIPASAFPVLSLEPATPLKQSDLLADERVNSVFEPVYFQSISGVYTCIKSAEVTKGSSRAEVRLVTCRDIKPLPSHPFVATILLLW